MNINRSYARNIAREKMRKQGIKFKHDLFREHWRKLFKGDPLPLRENRK